jgi:hypothetical protein
LGDDSTQLYPNQKDKGSTSPSTQLYGPAATADDTFLPSSVPKKNKASPMDAESPLKRKKDDLTVPDIEVDRSSPVSSSPIATLSPSTPVTPNYGYGNISAIRSSVDEIRSRMHYRASPETFSLSMKAQEVEQPKSLPHPLFIVGNLHGEHQGVRIIRSGKNMYLLDVAGSLEAALVHHMIATFELPIANLTTPVSVDPSTCTNPAALIWLQSDSTIQRKILQMNGFELRKHGRELQVVGMSKEIPFYGLKDLVELANVAIAGGTALPRPPRVLKYIQDEAKKKASVKMSDATLFEHLQNLPNISEFLTPIHFVLP